MRHKIVISDRSFNVVDEVQDIASNVRWEYNRVGGCGAFSFDIAEEFGSASAFGTNYNVKIYRRNPTDGDYDLWYQGRIEDKTNNIRGNTEVLQIRGNGYQSSLRDIYVDSDYSSKSVDYIVDDILTNDVAPNTDVIKGTISSTTFTADTYEINQTALSAIQGLAELSGNIEWGVDASRTFFFRDRSTSTAFRYPFGNDILEFSNNSTSKDIVNRVVVIGGDVAGSPFTRIVNDTTSQLKFGRRDKVIQNSAVVTNSVADQLGDSVLTEYREIVRRATCQLIGEEQIEATIPIGLFEIRPRGTRYGEKVYNSFLYSGLISYQINRIQYKLDNQGNLTTSLQLGQLRPSISETISRLEYKLEQEAAQGV